MRWTVLIIIISLLSTGCSQKAEKAKTEEPPAERIISMDEAAGSIPCFRCHAYQKFSSAQKGEFSHQLHKNTGYHCNQCHNFRWHKDMSMIVKWDVCGDCHSRMPIVFNKTALPSKFSHELHSKRSGCKGCHTSIFPMKAGAVQVSMQDLGKGLYCGACHDGKKAFSSSECSKCHNMAGFDKDLGYKTEGMGAVLFSHKFHGGAFACKECHPKLFEMKKTQGKMTMDEMNKGRFCGSCHDGNTAASLTDCNKCHKS
jgi:c(7)-type cytochrome triheme protein